MSQKNAHQQQKLNMPATRYGSEFKAFFLAGLILCFVLTSVAVAQLRATQVAGKLTTMLSPAPISHVTSATMPAAPTPTPPAGGYHSLSLNGTTSYATVPNSSSINITGSITVEAWIKLNSLTGDYQDILCRDSWGQAGTGGGYELSITNAGKLRFDLYQGPTTYTTVIGGTTISAAAWHHVAGVFNGSQMRVYLDGELDGSFSTTSGPASGTSFIEIGNTTYAGASYYLGGVIDEVRLSAGALYSSNFLPPSHLTATSGVTRGLWKFDGLAGSDASGNANDSTLYSGAAYSTDVPEIIENSLSLNGMDAYVQIPVSSGSSLNIAGAITLEAWVKYSSNGSSQDIITRESWGQSGTGGGYQLSISSTGKPRLDLYQSHNQYTTVVGTSTVSPGVWHHVAGVFDGTQMRVYLDGTLDATVNQTSGPATGTSPVRIGRNSTGTSNYFKGLIDEARVSSAALYTTNFIPATSLSAATGVTAGLWKFDGQTASDFSSNNNAGTLEGGANYSMKLTGEGNADNHPPDAADSSYTLHNGGFIGEFYRYDPDGGSLTGSIIGQPSHGTLNTIWNGPFRPWYSPAPGYSGQDSFVYRVCDAFNLCDTATITVNIVNQAPSAADGTYTLHTGQFLGELYRNDPDWDSMSGSIVSQPSHGTLNTIWNGPFMPWYTPTPGYAGQDSFVYRVCDNFNACDDATITINIVNHAPYAKDGSYKITTDNGGFIGYFSKWDPDEDSLTASIVTQPAHGILYTNDYGPLRPWYAPATGYPAPDSFVYQVCDPFGACAQGTIYINDDDANAGATSCNAFVGQPVNVSNGNMYLQETDYQLPGAGEAIDVTRTYNSNSVYVNLFGRGWSTVYDETIKTYSNANLRLFLPDGRAVDFTGTGTLTPVQGDFHGQIVRNSDDTYTLTFKDGRVHRFSTAGKLASLADRNNNQTTLAYDANGYLASVTDPFGRVLTVTSSNGRVLSISDSMGVIATYTYGAADKLLTVTYADNSGYVFAYDSSNHLTSVTDALGHVLESHTYDSSGRALTSQKDGGVELFTLNYVNGTETDVTDALGHVTKYFFDKSKGHNVVTRIEGSCACSPTNVQTWTYDNQLNVTSKTDAANHTTSFTYDASGNPLTVTNALGTITLTYNSFGDLLTVTDPMNGVTINTYDAHGNLLTTKDALNNTTTFTYNTFGELLTSRDALNHVTTLTWNTSGQLAQMTNAANHSTAYTYDARGRITTLTNALNEATDFDYDDVGRLKKVIYPDTSYVQHTYDIGGRRTKVRDARGNETSFAYDAANRLTSVTNVDNKTTSYAYDLMSHVTSVTDALNRTTSYEYDSLNRLNKITRPPATTGATPLTEQIAYDAGGRVTSRTDEAGRVTSSEYDSANRLIKVTGPTLQATQYEYNARSEMTAVADALNQRYEFAYDAVGRVTQVTRGGLSMSYVYDAVGNRTQRTDYNNQTTNYAYDNLNRLTAVTYPDTTTVNYSYDTLSRLSSATNASGTVSLNYDSRGRVSTTTDVFNQVIGYGYDANGNRTSLSLGQNVNATYQYDSLNRLTQITDSTNASVGYSYDATNKLTSRTLPNGVTATYQYDGLDRLTRLTDATSTATITDAQYQHNTASQITQIAEPAQTRNIAYDPADRLTSVTNPSQTLESYSYDGVGNRTASHLSSSYSYQPFNKVVAIGSTSYAYDNNGNLTSKTDSSGTWVYTWDYENRLKQVTRPDSTTVSYKYDALGRRIQRSKSTGGSTNFVYDGQDVIKDINSDNSTVEYLNGPGIDNKLRQTNSAGTVYFSQDHLGSTRALTDSSGNVVESVSYDSFGNGSSSLTRYGYTGREWDADANLYYYRNRWYDPQVGRFISEDPIGFKGGVNWYSYVGNNPTGFVDPLGLNPWAMALEFAEFGAAFGGVPGALIGGSLGIVVGYIIWHADCNALTAGVDRLITPYINAKTNDAPRTIPLAPPMPPLPRDNDWEEITVYRGLNGWSPSAFKIDDDGLSTYELLTPGNYKLALPFTIRYQKPKLSGVTGYIINPPIPGATATYTPLLGDPRFGINHWSLNLPGSVEEQKDVLSKYAKKYRSEQ